ncbi:hypothetical protein BBD41_17040 [Paenibacillus ihbetae]|uniref:Uncharacterized protein n=1 Tax=Paenibacillus ihbetae TaxID=1870820 RepID=A0A1B2E2I6_9BACL|nr:hypothetical protein BBD41_17040 [Paenibacillus ihbetae]
MKTQKIIIYFVIGIVPVFVLLTVLGDVAEGAEGGGIQRSIEWVTTYVLPWIFLYWFIKLVRKINRIAASPRDSGDPGSSFQ